MNSTQWATLTEFVEYLSPAGKCKVEETSKGWFITYIDRDSETIFKEWLKNKQIKSDVVEKEKQKREIKKQMELTEQMMPALANGSGEKPELCPSQSEPTGKINFSLGSSSKLAAAENPKNSKPDFEELEAEVTTNKHESNTSGMKAGGSSALDTLTKEQEMAKERSN